MEYILASTNAHKAEELQDLLGSTGMTIIAAPEKLEIIEDGATFQENALKKAKGYYDQFNRPTVSDDSGLVIPAKPDILGVYSARFAPEYSDYKDKNRVLLETLGGLSEEDRKAYFVCYLCFYHSPDEIFFFEGRVHGHIGYEAKGSDGFGYDPVFMPDGVEEGKSLAQVGEWKMKNSHRAKACKEAVTFFSDKK
jgi:XTP/dITP diphosphohydrolase